MLRRRISAQSLTVLLLVCCCLMSVFAVQGAYAKESVHQRTSRDTYIPKAPPVSGKLKVTAKADSTVSICWTAPKSRWTIGGYAVYRNGARVGETTGTTYEDSGLSGGTDYTYTVKTLNAAGDESAPSAPLTVTTRILISQDTEWNNPDPYIIKSGLIIAPGATLNILSGTVVKLYPGAGITVNGVLNIISGSGTTVFTSVNDPAFGGKGIKSSADYWDCIVIAPGGSFNGENVKVTYGDRLFDVRGFLGLVNSEMSKANTLGISVEAGGMFSGSNVKISYCCNQSSCKGIYAQGEVYLAYSEISDCPGTGVAVSDTGSFSSTASTIRNCDKGVDVQGSISMVLCSINNCKYGLYFNSSVHPYVSLNSFTQNKCYGIYNNSAAVEMDVTGNYWGSAGGPSVYDGAAKKWVGSGDKVSTGVIYSPWLDAAP